MTNAMKASGKIACGDAGCLYLTADEATALYQAAHRQAAERAARLPDDTTAIRALTDAHSRLMELGWRDATYAPSDYSPLQIIEVGSSGIQSGHRDVEGRFWIQEAGDLWPSRPVLFRV